MMAPARSNRPPRPNRCSNSLHCFRGFFDKFLDLFGLVFYKMKLEFIINLIYLNIYKFLCSSNIMNFNINNISEQLAFILVSNYLKNIIQRLILIILIKHLPILYTVVLHSPN